jgi:hypothetical protein
MRHRRSCPVDREVAVEHRALRSEGGDAVLDIRPPRRSQFLRARRQVANVMDEPKHPQAEPAELGMVHPGVKAEAEWGEPGKPSLAHGRN